MARSLLFWFPRVLMFGRLRDCINRELFSCILIIILKQSLTLSFRFCFVSVTDYRAQTPVLPLFNTYAQYSSSIHYNRYKICVLYHLLDAAHSLDKLSSVWARPTYTINSRVNRTEAHFPEKCRLYWPAHSLDVSSSEGNTRLFASQSINQTDQVTESWSSSLICRPNNCDPRKSDKKFGITSG